MALVRKARQVIGPRLLLESGDSVRDVLRNGERLGQQVDLPEVRDAEGELRRRPEQDQDAPDPSATMDGTAM